MHATMPHGLLLFSGRGFELVDSYVKSDLDTMSTCAVTIEFEDLAMGEPVSVTVDCAKSSPYFEYRLRKALHRKKRVPPISQRISQTKDNSYKLAVRNRNTANALTVYGHAFDEYQLMIDNEDKVIDLKFLLAPLIDTQPEYIQLNYNTLRRLNDSENLIQSNCLSPSIKVMWWLEIENKKGNETPIYRSVSHLTKVHPSYTNFGESIRKICAKFGDQVETFGVRKYLDPNDLSLRGEYEFINYQIINDKITKLAAAFCHLGLSKQKRSMVGLCSRNRREWLLCDYASSLQSLVSIPLYSTLDANAIEFITNHAKIQLIVVDKEQCEEIYELRKNKKAKALKYIVLMDQELPDQLFGKANPHMFDYTVTELEQLGEQYMKTHTYKDVYPTSNDLCTIMYTSGTTGNPKGVMLSQESVMTILATCLEFDPDAMFNIKDPVHLSYLPLAHIFERVINLWSLSKGRPVTFFNGDQTRLVEDILMTKPQVMIGVPRIWQKIQDTVMNKINSSPFMVRKVFEYAYDHKLNRIKNRQNPLWIFEKTLFKKFRAAFGGRLTQVVSGGAPLSTETAEFLKVCLSENVTEGYGLTECMTGCTSHEFDLKYGHVGVPTIVTELKLVSVPEMEYLVTDKPCPRGEVWLRSKSLFVGYYKNKEKTKEVLDSKTGWFKTGDIGLWREEGRLQIIDRKKNIFKLSQGEYVRPEYVQNIYRGSAFVANVFVYGDSFQRFLVGIIVVDKEALKMHLGVEMEHIDQMVSGEDERIVQLIQKDLIVQADKVKLNSFERVKKFKLISEDFTVENGLLTTSMKLKRNAAKLKFQKEIDMMYAKRSKL
eukprot:483037_1